MPNTETPGPISIALTSDDRGVNWHASLVNADKASGWCRSPEAAVVALLDQLRGEYKDLANRSTRRQDTLTDDENWLLLWLVGLFG